MKEVCESPLRLERSLNVRASGEVTEKVCWFVTVLRPWRRLLGLLAVFRCHNSAYVIPRLLLTSHATTLYSTNHSRTWQHRILCSCLLGYLSSDPRPQVFSNSEQNFPLFTVYMYLLFEPFEFKTQYNKYESYIYRIQHKSATQGTVCRNVKTTSVLKCVKFRAIY